MDWFGLPLFLELLPLPRASPALGGFNRNTCSFERASVTHLFLVQSPHRDWFYLQMLCSAVNECFVVSSTMAEWEFIYSARRMPPWDCEILSISALGPLHPIKLCFTNSGIALNFHIAYSLKEESSVCTAVFLFHSLNYTCVFWLAF